MKLQAKLNEMRENQEFNSQIIEFDVLCDRLFAMADKEIQKNNFFEVSKNEADLLDNLIAQSNYIVSQVLAGKDMHEKNNEYYNSKMENLQNKIRDNLNTYICANIMDDLISDTLDVIDGSGTCH